MSLSLSMDFQFQTTLEKAWSALTDSNKLALWITENDFKAEVGHRFTFRHQPSEYWDGIVEGEVIVVEKSNSFGSAVWSMSLTFLMNQALACIPGMFIV